MPGKQAHLVQTRANDTNLNRQGEHVFFPPAEYELTHIAVMIGWLERLPAENRGRQANVVMRPDDWRARINAALTSPNLPRQSRRWHRR
jgi:hypothetical protein